MSDLILEAISLVIGSKSIVVVVVAYALGLGIIATILHLWRYERG